MKKEDKQQSFPEISRLEIDQINKKIDKKIAQINESVCRLIITNDDLDSKNSCLKTLDLLISGVIALGKIQGKANSKSIVTMTKDSSRISDEKISVRVKSKEFVLDIDGNLIHTLTSDFRLM